MQQAAEGGAAGPSGESVLGVVGAILPATIGAIIVLPILRLVARA